MSNAEEKTRPSLPTQSPVHHPFYCEENIWHLCQTFPSQTPRPLVLFISNPGRTVLFCNQRAGDERGIVVWDYHVVLLASGTEWQVWDLDAKGGYPQACSTYLAQAFPHLWESTSRSSPPTMTGDWNVPTTFAPSFRVVPAETYSRMFASDRRHMRDGNHQWTQSPPPWPCIGQGHTLDEFIDVERRTHGEVLDFEGFFERYACQ